MKALGLGLFLTMMSSYSLAIPTTQNLGLINLNVDAPSVSTRIDYPRLQGSEDCLVVVAEGDAIWWSINQAELAQAIVIEEGFEFALPGARGGSTTLSPLHVDETFLAYTFASQDLFVTGIRIRTADGSTLRNTLTRLVRRGHSLPNFVGLQRTRQCSLN